MCHHLVELCAGQNDVCVSAWCIITASNEAGGYALSFELMPCSVAQPTASTQRNTAQHSRGVVGPGAAPAAQQADGVAAEVAALAKVCWAHKWGRGVVAAPQL